MGDRLLNSKLSDEFLEGDIFYSMRESNYFVDKK